MAEDWEYNYRYGGVNIKYYAMQNNPHSIVFKQDYYLPNFEITDSRRLIFEYYLFDKKPILKTFSLIHQHDLKMSILTIKMSILTLTNLKSLRRSMHTATFDLWNPVDLKKTSDRLLPAAQKAINEIDTLLHQVIAKPKIAEFKNIENYLYLFLSDKAKIEDIVERWTKVNFSAGRKDMKRYLDEWQKQRPNAKYRWEYIKDVSNNWIHGYERDLKVLQKIVIESRHRKRNSNESSGSSHSKETGSSIGFDDIESDQDYARRMQRKRFQKKEDMEDSSCGGFGPGHEKDP